MADPKDVKDKLKPCPFCGDMPEVIHATVPYDEWFLEHRCGDDMWMFIHLGPRDSYEPLVQTWNARQEQQPAVSCSGELHRALEEVLPIARERYKLADESADGLFPGYADEQYLPKIQHAEEVLQKAEKGAV